MTITVDFFFRSSYFLSLQPSFPLIMCFLSYILKKWPTLSYQSKNLSNSFFYHVLKPLTLMIFPFKRYISFLFMRNNNLNSDYTLFLTLKINLHYFHGLYLTNTTFSFYIHLTIAYTLITPFSLHSKSTSTRLVCYEGLLLCLVLISFLAARLWLSVGARLEEERKYWLDIIGVPRGAHQQNLYHRPRQRQVTPGRQIKNALSLSSLFPLYLFYSASLLPSPLLFVLIHCLACPFLSCFFFTLSLIPFSPFLPNCSSFSFLSLSTFLTSVLFFL